MTPDALARACLGSLPPWKVLAIAGESGAGKTTLASAIAKLADATLLHQDDYFRLAPDENHAARQNDLGWVGLQEVDFDRLQGDIEAVQQGVRFIHPPQRQSAIAVGGSRLVVEGTYALYLAAFDVSIFVDRTFQQTRDDRAVRGRDKMDPFVEEVLRFEQPIVRARAHLATLTVTDAFELKPNSMS